MQVPIRLSQTNNMISTYILHGEVGHSFEECKEFKQTLQDLMDMQLIQVGCCYDSNVNMIDKSALGDTQITLDIEIVKQLMVIPRPLTIHYTKNDPPQSNIFPKPITIQIPSPFPYKDSKAIPWKYDVEVLKTGSPSDISSIDKTPIVTKLELVQ